MTLSDYATVERCAHDFNQFSQLDYDSLRGILYSYLAQSVERMTVNHDVAGSSPAVGAIKCTSSSVGRATDS